MRVKVTERQFMLLLNNLYLLKEKGITLQMRGATAKKLFKDYQRNES
jgi:hypothetical protein